MVMKSDRPKLQTDAQASRPEAQTPTPTPEPAPAMVAMDVGFFDDAAFDDTPSGRASA